MQDLNELIAIGKISGTHGIKGQLKLYSYSGNMESLLSATVVKLKKVDDSKFQSFAITAVKPHTACFIVTLQGFDNINQVLHLVGSEVFLTRGQFPETEAGEYYWRDLIGLNVITLDGVELGKLSDIFETGSNDIYVVKQGKKEYLIPAIESVINNIDLSSGVMTITPLDGLLDL